MAPPRRTQLAPSRTSPARLAQNSRFGSCREAERQRERGRERERERERERSREAERQRGREKERPPAKAASGRS